MLLHNEEGYTLLELMVVILIVAILFALAVVTYAGVRNAGFDTEAKVNLRHGVTAAQTYFTDKDNSFNGMNALELSKIAVGISFRDGNVTSDGDVFISEVGNTNYLMKCRSKSGNVFEAAGNHTKVEYNF